MRSKWLLLLCIRLLLLPSAARCSSLPWSKRPNDQRVGLGLKKMWLVVAWLVAKISGRAIFSLGKKPKHTILYKEKCILCARTTLLLLVCRQERAADRSFNGTFLGLAYLPSLAPFQGSQSTKSEYDRQKGQDRSSPLHAVFYFPHENPNFLVYCCVTPSCVTPVGSTS